LEALKKKFKKDVTAKELFYYTYAVLYSNIFRRKYSEFLMISFPRIPFTGDYTLFQRISSLGENLCNLHLLDTSVSVKGHATFPIGGDDNIKKIKYDKNNERVYINKTQYFGNVQPEVWEYHIGGYQILYKWLKDRKGSKLKYDEQTTYLRIISTIVKTIKIQKEIDEKYFEIEKNLVESPEVHEKENNLTNYLLRD